MMVSTSSTGELRVEQTPIPGLLVIRLPVHGDTRGWFKENWQREKMVALGVPDFGPVQNNMSFNQARGATRGIHTEPWDKFVSVAHGKIFGAWVDMREGATFGTTFYVEIDESVAVYVPRGVGNSYQALTDGAVCSYLVNDHYRPGMTYPALALDDAQSAIPWPIPLAEAEISAKDRANPTLDAVTPIKPRRTLILGANGQLGHALRELYPDADALDLPEFDITDVTALAKLPWSEYGVILNASAYTAVDAAETPEGRPIAWAVNAVAPTRLATIAREHGLTLVHYSTDYVFDGTATEHTMGHPEDEPLSPLGVYAQTKAAGDLGVSTAPRHYLLRTSWVVGEGKNFVRTMQTLAANGVSPTVVDDQVGRLTFTSELARATQHLLDGEATYGTYNVTNGGAPTSWADLAKAIFRLSGRDEADVTPISSEEYAAGKVLAPRPLRSTLDLTKIEATGFQPEDALTALARYCSTAAAAASERP
jgi:dTDP-4-dehydrorhamnose reductase/dTDP-4-dehydrorhamnose 3,5-epimerase